MVCNKYGAPKWIFILRLAAHERLYTRDRLVKWGLTKNPDCPLCQTGLETIGHLFFQCTYSATVWRELLKWQGIQRLPMEWTRELQWANEHAKGRNNKAEVYRMVMAASVYHLWIERNNRIFQQKTRAPAVLLRLIIHEVFYRGHLKARLAYRLEQLNFYP
ncbi:uncharacterized protein LOC132061986 [Lycium ferocissimum]|uniref:uncharacterized protein LOC132061986 n=1 Tax=Lycium ferocissimum TaxID=112874 RepID=UPI0028159F1F|nr:uncharacterized protein LOC132061986 [Lycium ferocissimum]